MDWDLPPGAGGSRRTTADYVCRACRHHFVVHGHVELGEFHPSSGETDACPACGNAEENVVAPEDDPLASVPLEDDETEDEDDDTDDDTDSDLDLGELVEE